MTKSNDADKSVGDPKQVLPRPTMPSTHPPEIAPHLGWYSRGYPPHFDAPHVIQHVTFRLADSLPSERRDAAHYQDARPILKATRSRQAWCPRSKIGPGAAQGDVSPGSAKSASHIAE